MSDIPDVDTSIRPDPFFKQLTRLEATQLGLTVAPTEQQFSTLADIVLIVPSGVRLEDSLFDFCRTENIIEFKSENDQLTLAEFVRNSIRTEVSFLSRQEPDFAKILNVIVTSREPKAFLAQALAHGIQFQAEVGRPGLL